MNTRNAKMAIKKLARREGITEREICKEIEDVIHQAQEQARKTADWETLERWSKIPCKGESPTAYELVAYLARESSVGIK